MREESSENKFKRKEEKTELGVNGKGVGVDYEETSQVLRDLSSGFDGFAVKCALEKRKESLVRIAIFTQLLQSRFARFDVIQHLLKLFLL